MSTDASVNAPPLPRWVRRFVAVVAVVAGVSFIFWHNHFYATPSVIMLSLGWTAVVSTVYLLWRVGVAGAESGETAASWWIDATPRDELEREKRALLRSIRDIEFDHQTGKLSDRDAEEMNRVTRARAIEVMKALDEVEAGAGDVRAQIEREVRARLEVEGARKAGKGKVSAKKGSKLAAKEAARSAKAAASAEVRAETVAGAPVAAAAAEPAPPAPGDDDAATDAVAERDEAVPEAASQLESGGAATAEQDGAAAASDGAAAAPPEPSAVVEESGKARSPSLEGSV